MGLLSAFTEPRFPRTAIGIEGDTVCAVSMRKNGKNSFSFANAAALEVPAGILVPNFLEANIRHPQHFANSLSEAVDSAGLGRQKKWSVSLPAATARTVVLTLDAAPQSKKELDEMLDWKAEQAFGAPAAEMRSAINKLPDDGSGKAKFISSAIRLAVLEEYENVFKSLGWTCGLVLPRPLSEASFLQRRSDGGDSLLISAQDHGFTAVLVQNSIPTVVRSVSCDAGDADDELFRLMMYYHDRFSATGQSELDEILVIGNGILPARVGEISKEAFGTPVPVLSSTDVGVEMPVSSLSFADVAAAAGLATLAWN